MDNKKFLRFCPNCTHYDQSTGICSYLHENVREYPSSFIKFCNGEYLSLIKGKKIIPEYKLDDDEEIIPEMVTVYEENNSSVFQIAKTMLSEQGIKFWSNGEYAGVMRSRIPYALTIKVVKKDEKAARKILNSLTSSGAYVASNETDRKINAFIGRWGIVIIIVSIALMIAAFFIFNEK